MNTFARFIYEILSIFFGGVIIVFKGFVNGVKQIFAYKDYKYLIENYASDFNTSEWVLVVVVALIFLIIIGLIIFIIVFLIKKYIRFRRTVVDQEALLEEVGNLNMEVANLVKENERIMAMKVSQLGLKPDESPTIEGASSTPLTSENGEEASEEEAELNQTDNLRFPQLCRVDMQLGNTKILNYNNTRNLEEILDDFRCFAASKLHLYYNPPLLRVFFAGLGCGKMIILQGISGTGKTSLAYAWAKFNGVNPCISSVQPSWRDRSDFFGYLNEFTKRFNETDALVEIYRALYDDRIHTIVLDEMNLARVEYYFAEVLSILEMKDRNEWVVGLVTSMTKEDPKKLDNGKIKLNGNIWYIGTINNDDSTFLVTDKVYDRAMPIDINTKVNAFDCRVQESVELNCSYLESLFEQATKDYAMSEDTLKLIEKLDDFVIKHFRVAFGNRIMRQLNVFVPVYKACGGEETDAIDYFICKKILRKLEMINIAYVRDEFDPFVEFCNQTFGEYKMHECIDYVMLLKKNS